MVLYDATLNLRDLNVLLPITVTEGGGGRGGGGVLRMPGYLMNPLLKERCGMLRLSFKVSQKLESIEQLLLGNHRNHSIIKEFLKKCDQKYLSSNLPETKIFTSRPVHTMRLVVHSLFQIHRFVNYFYDFSMIIQKNRIIQTASASNEQFFRDTNCCELKVQSLLISRTNFYGVGLADFRARQVKKC